MDYMHLALQIALGISLSACAGLRAFFPLLVICILQRMGYIQVGPTFNWIGSTPALIVFVSATIVEIVGDKVPGMDHILDSIGTAVKPAAGAVLFSASILKMDPLLTVVLGLIVGGAVAETIHLKKASVRLGVTATTAGAGNAVASIFEDIGTLIGTTISFLSPILAVICVMLGMILSYYVVKWIKDMIVGVINGIKKRFSWRKVQK